MLNFLGSAIGGISSLIGGLFGQSNQEKIAQQNIAMQQEFAQHGVTWKAQDATAAEKATGINRLALLGVPTSSFSNNVGSNDLGQGIAGAGQEIGRAVAANAPRVLRQQELEERLTQAKIDNVNADTVRQQAEASALVRKFASPGSPTGINFLGTDASGNEIKSNPRLFQDFTDRGGQRVTLLGKDASQSLMNAASIPMGVPIGAGLIGANIPNFVDANRIEPVVVRPDVYRGVYPDSVFGAMY